MATRPLRQLPSHGRRIFGGEPILSDSGPGPWIRQLGTADGPTGRSQPTPHRLLACHSFFSLLTSASVSRAATSGYSSYSGFRLLAPELCPTYSGFWLLASCFWLLASGLCPTYSGFWLLARISHNRTLGGQIDHFSGARRGTIRLVGFFRLVRKNRPVPREPGGGEIARLGGVKWLHLAL